MWLWYNLSRMLQHTSLILILSGHPCRRIIPTLCNLSSYFLTPLGPRLAINLLQHLDTFLCLASMLSISPGVLLHLRLRSGQYECFLLTT